MRKITILMLGIVIGATVTTISEPQQARAVVPLARPTAQSKTYRVDFEGKRCEFCGCNKAKYYEFSARSDGATTAQYLCQECREFNRYK